MYNNATWMVEVAESWYYWSFVATEPSAQLVYWLYSKGIEDAGVLDARSCAALHPDRLRSPVSSNHFSAHHGSRVTGGALVIFHGYGGCFQFRCSRFQVQVPILKYFFRVRVSMYAYSSTTGSSTRYSWLHIILRLVLGVCHTNMIVGYMVKLV